MSEPVAPPSSDAVGVEPIPELVRLGEQLAQARERAGLSVEDLARQLRVEPRLLQALEGANHSQLPEGVFIVALARRIAGSLNANLEDAIANVRQSRLMEHRPAARSNPADGLPTSLPRRASMAPPPASRARRRASSPQPSFPWRWPLAALLAAAGATAAWLLFNQTPTRPPAAPTSAAPPVAPTTAATPPAAPSENDTLRLLASEPSWVEVRDATGRTLFEGTLSGEKRFPIGGGLEVIAGRPYAVRAAIGSASPTPLGGVDDIRWKRFSPGGLTPTAPASSPPSP
ncbi:MAG: helix-turn-helix domain-containing protein [Cyanobacteriota bacterium]|nr:helix-turn-helix domain-containing protein [Cyanobacteriota bacterium]